MTRPELLAVGELVWDCYPKGTFIGGAPFNVAVQLARHGYPAALLTAVGQDQLGERALAFLDREGIAGARVHPRLPTGTVAVDLDPEGRPAFTIHDSAAWTDLAGAAPVSGSAGSLRPAVLVYGALAMHAEGNRALLSNLLDAWGAGGRGAPTLLCDLNLRPGWEDPAVVRWCLTHCRYLKVNQDELEFLARLEDRPLAGTVPWLLHRYQLAGVCLTCGPGGLVWHGADGGRLALPVWGEAEGAPPMVDTVGAGDAVTAAVAAGLAEGEAPERFLDRGRRWAGLTCGASGALPPAGAP
jgi:fructokinase